LQAACEASPLSAGGLLDAGTRGRLIAFMAPGAKRPRGGKQVTAQAGIGQEGINLIEQIVLRMGSAWHPGNASMDAGIDGQIELVDPTTREATNSIIRVQSKATTKPFPAESADGFEWPVTERDLDYWLSGNAPSVLIVSRPRDGEAYWVALRDYFDTPAKRKTLRVRFDKRTMRFTPDSLETLYRLAVPKDAGIYIAPRQREEKLYSNLLAISGFPERLWIGETDLRRPREVYAKLYEAGVAASEFVLRDRRLLAPYDLTERPWSTFVDRGTVEEINTNHWAASEDRDLIDRFVELLTFCLGARCRQIDCERFKDRGRWMYYFAPTKDLSPRVVPYRSVKESTRRTVFLAYPYTKGDRVGEVAYYRHAAFFGEFRRFDGQWYLAVTPTYFFTSDGYRRHPFYESKLKGIKALEKNATVLGHVVMWATLLRGRDEDDDGFFFTPPYPHLRFGKLATFDLPVGIEDATWLPNEVGKVAESVSLTADDLPLFQEPDPYADDGAGGPADEDDAA
jgi:hypothetical protein